MSAAHAHSHRCGAGLAELADRLRRGARKLTGPRQLVLEVLRLSRHPQTPKEIHAQIAGQACDLATVYRSLKILADLGMVQRFDFGDGVARFELVAEGEDGHHHHLICTHCSRVIELDECFLEEIERRIATANGFRAVTHKLEFFGLCPACQ
jgi:Fur family ferric uptake transcriptional regulator